MKGKTKNTSAASGMDATQMADLRGQGPRLALKKGKEGCTLLSVENTVQIPKA
jgi:hypothetical protein